MDVIVRTQPKFKLSDVDWIGFDMDHALVRYKCPAVVELVYSAISQNLVDMGYSTTLLEPFDPAFAQRGLIMEMKTGNLLVLNDDGIVVRAWHGCHHQLTDAELENTYGQKEMDGYQLLRDQRCDGFAPTLSNFDTPENLAMARLVDAADAAGKSYDFWDDMWKAVRMAFHWEHYFAGVGGFFSEIQKNVGAYVESRPGLRGWLIKLRQRGQRLFLATNSHLDYSNLIMSFILGDDWMSLFDLVVVWTAKPSFFMDTNLFQSIELRDGVVHTLGTATELKMGAGVYSRGNAAGIQALADAVKADPNVTSVRLEDVRQVSLAAAASIAYVGDHLHGDIAASSKFGWHAIAILEELEAWNSVDVFWNIVRIPRSLERHCGSLGHYAATTNMWGEFFYLDAQARTRSHWTWLLQKHASLCVSDVEVLQMHKLV